MEKYENTGASIKPSARRSIHSQSSSFADNQNMGRFGLRTKNNTGETAGTATGLPLDEGEDEVDNVLSKFSPPSPLTSKLVFERRNSFNTPNKLYSREEEDDDDIDDSDDKVLSKSLPAYFPSYSHSSDIPTSWQKAQHSDSSIRSNVTQNSERSNNESSNTFHYEAHFSQLHERDKVQKKTTYNMLIFPVLVIALGIIYSMCRNVPNVSVSNVNYDKSNFYNDMNNLRQKYRITDDSVLRVKSGISSIFEKSDASSFIFVYDSQSNHFNTNDFNKFMNEVSFTAAKYLRNDTTSVDFVEIDGSKLDIEHGDLVSKYREQVTKKGVMLVKNIDRIPSTLAMDFHYYCDEYDPLARKSAIFFTLNVARCSNTVQKSIHENIEQCLAKKWDDVPQDNIKPLLTRVVNVVVDVTSVF